MNGREDFWIDAIDTSVSHSCHVMFHCLITAGLEPWLVLGKTCHSCFGVLLHLPRCVALGILLAVHHLWHPIPIGPPLSYCTYPSGYELHIDQVIGYQRSLHENPRKSTLKYRNTFGKCGKIRTRTAKSKKIAKIWKKSTKFWE